MALATGLLAGAAACAERPTAVSYVDQIAAERALKDEAFREDPESPIRPADRTIFLPLAYFRIDPAYRVPAALVPADAFPTIEMPTSTGKRRPMRRAGRLQFVVNDQPLSLTAFVPAEDRTMRSLFVPFSDLTSGTETYATGRYLDLDRTATGLYDLDFNRAYHPYCFFDERYDCPYPPPENRLPIPIRAGERLPDRTTRATR